MSSPNCPPSHGRAFTHIALHIKALKPSIAFYRDLCGLVVVHERTDNGTGVAWMADKGHEDRFVIVLIEGGDHPAQEEDDFSHIGIAVESRAEVDAIAAHGRDAGCLAWEPTDLPYPVGYFCGLRDPDGKIVEFSYGQPLGPGAPKH
ncbi:MAG: VOC family protein [Alphaproteobacteria bacterium]